MDDFFKPEDFTDFVDENSDYADHCAEAANSKRDKYLEQAIKIIKKGAGFGIIECQEWLEKWGNE